MLVLVLAIGLFQFSKTSDEKKSPQISKAGVSERNAEEKENSKSTIEQDIANPEKAIENKENTVVKKEKKVEQEESIKEKHEPAKMMKDIEKVQQAKGITLNNTKGKVTNETDYYSLHGEKQGTLKKGDTIELAIEQGSSYVVNYKKEMYYISKESINPIVGSESTARKFKAIEDLKVYKQADTQSKLIAGKINLGKVVTVVGAKNNLYKVVFEGGYGYIERSKVMPQI